jgi:DNA-binding LacI/PurR family transcriptional regulator
VRAGRYQPGSVLPQAKQLAAEHGVCARTLRTALRQLTDRKVLRYDRRRLAVPASGRLRSSACLALLTPGDAQGNLRLLTTRAHEYIRALEAECSRRNMALMVITYDAAAGRPFSEDALAALTADRIAAPVLGSLLLAGEACPVDVIERLAAGGKPLAVLDENGAIAAWPGWRRIPQAQLFCVAFSELAGAEVGRYLLDLGHRRVAYLSPMHSATWSRRRMAGLVRAFTSGAGQGAASAFTRDAPADVTQARRLPPGLAKRLRVVERIRGLQDQVGLVLQRELIRPALLPLVGQALRRRDITAWVAANDSVALECMDLLRSRHVAVPGEVSVVGFDNSLPAFHQGLTSYAFNEAALMHAMVEHVLGSRPPRRPRAGSPPVEIEGFVVARRSTRAPASQG